MIFERLRSFFSGPLEIYTDGSAQKNFGSWAYVLVRKQLVLREDSRRVRDGASNAMEFQAAIEALRSLPVPTRAVLYSDSRLLVDAMTLWMPQWKAADWAPSKGRAIPWLAQMQELDRLNRLHSIEWKWIRAHAGQKHNERCDWLCRQSLLR